MAPKKTGLVGPIYRPLIGCILFGLSSSLWAQLAADALERLSNFLPGINAAMVEPAPFPGVYQIKYGLDVYYISADGDYLIAGSLMELSTGLNLTEESRKSVRLEVIDQIDPQEKIILPPGIKSRSSRCLPMWAALIAGNCIGRSVNSMTPA